MTDKLTVAAYKTNASGGTQITIEHTNEDGRGWGRRLAGPKHYNMGTTTLVSRELDGTDAREIRQMLDAAFPLAESPVPSQFRVITCLELRCALCDTVLGEDENAIEHHASQKDAEESALAQSWHKLADGRLICDAEDEEHSAALIEPEPHVEINGQLPLATSEESAR